MATLKEMAERLRSAGGDGLCISDELMRILGESCEGCPKNEDGTSMTCYNCREMMRHRLADALEACEPTPFAVFWPDRAVFDEISKSILANQRKLMGGE